MHTEEAQISQPNIKETQNSSLRQNEKENDSSSKFIEQIKGEEIEQKNDIFSPIDILCKCGNPIIFYCSSYDCSQSAVLCNESKPLCQQKHGDCISLLKAKNLHRKINQKIIKIRNQNQTILKQIQVKINQIIDKVSEMQTSLESQLKTFGLNSSEDLFIAAIFKQFNPSIKAQICQQTQQFINYVKKKAEHEQISFDGQFMKQFENQYQYSEKNRFNSSLDKYKSIIRQTKKCAITYCEQVEDLFLDLHLKHDKQQIKELIKYFANSKILEQPSSLSYDTDFQKFKQFLTSNIEYKSIRKLFTSRMDPKYYFNNKYFDEQELIRLIEGEQNLLFLFENNYGKKMGFFSASKFQSSNKQWIVEQYNMSFIFSLDCNIAQKLTNTTYKNLSLKYDSKNKTISLGQYYENTTNQNYNQHTSKNGFNFSFNQNPHCEMILPPRSKQQIGGLFGGHTQINYRLINGVEFNGNGKRIQKLQIYKVELL